MGKPPEKIWKYLIGIFVSYLFALMIIFTVNDLRQDLDYDSVDSTKNRIDDNDPKLGWIDGLKYAFGKSYPNMYKPHCEEPSPIKGSEEYNKDCYKRGDPLVRIKTLGWTTFLFFCVYIWRNKYSEPSEESRDRD